MKIWYILHLHHEANFPSIKFNGIIFDVDNHLKLLSTFVCAGNAASIRKFKFWNEYSNFLSHFKISLDLL